MYNLPENAKFIAFGFLELVLTFVPNIKGLAKIVLHCSLFLLIFDLQKLNQVYFDQKWSLSAFLFILKAGTVRERCKRCASKSMDKDTRVFFTWRFLKIAEVICCLFKCRLSV